MELKQLKLTKSEWESMEVPVSAAEQEILQLIVRGFHNVNLRTNATPSLLGFLKLEHTPEMEDYLYQTYFAETMGPWCKSLGLVLDAKRQATPKKADLIRLQRNAGLQVKNHAGIYEGVLMEVAEQGWKAGGGTTGGGAAGKGDLARAYYTLHHLLAGNRILHLNRHVVAVCKRFLDLWEEQVPVASLVEQAVHCIEKNDKLLRYQDRMLYDHQKDIFTAVKAEPGRPRLILYMAPTGTGKTLTPLGLSETHRIIFVCAARHVGLALARAAISVNKRVGFAFGCESAGDIRLHYFAAKEVTRNRRTGGIWKVDNSVGDKVEILICDIQSYLPAMLYMMAFHTTEELLVYWDEPTISLDYEAHELHALIQRNWSQNQIPNMVLSSATLPALHELTETTADFEMRFPGAQVRSIVSHDCKKSIPCVDKNGYVCLPHLLHREYARMQEVVEHCESMLTLMRYFDLHEVVRCIQYLHAHGFVRQGYRVERHFPHVADVDMKNVKRYYLTLLKQLTAEEWPLVYAYFAEHRSSKLVRNDGIDPQGKRLGKTVSLGPGVGSSAGGSGSGSGSGSGVGMHGRPLQRLACAPEPVVAAGGVGAGGGAGGGGGGGGGAIYVTTKDAFTLTDGPTLFLAEDIEKVAMFCIQQARIPAQVMEDIAEKIRANNEVNQRIEKLEKEVEAMYEKKEAPGSSASTGGAKKEHKLERSAAAAAADGDARKGPDAKKWSELERLKALIRVARLNDTFVPNTLAHVEKWAGHEDILRRVPGKPFSCTLDDTTIEKIMMLGDVQDSWKVLLLMGIGVFAQHESVAYTEIMKSLADQQHLYLVIASSDYIYGTNYQFCHAYLSKDLALTQEKLVQAMGRIGRNHIQQDYTIRFRDDEQLAKLFHREEDKREVANMNRLFSSTIVAEQ